MIATCASCRSHFLRPQLEASEDPAAGLKCPACLEWERLIALRDAYKQAIGGRRSRPTLTLRGTRR